MAGLTEFYCGWNEPSHASQFKWLEYTFNSPDRVTIVTVYFNFESMLRFSSVC
jgi:hypothetical protein